MAYCPPEQKCLFYVFESDAGRLVEGQAKKRMIKNEAKSQHESEEQGDGKRETRIGRTKHEWERERIGMRRNYFTNRLLDIEKL